MGGNWNCCSQGFDYVEEGMWKAESIVVLGVLGTLEIDKGFGTGEGKWR